MARRKANAPLRVVLNGRDVGTLTRQSSGAIDFRYGQDWLNWDNAIPVSLSLPLREDPYVGDPVLAVFENLLPDSKPIRERVAARVGAGGTDAFSLLGAIGRDCVGALQFLREDHELGEVGTIIGEAMSDEAIAELLNNLQVAPLGLGEDDSFRISVAGAQEKTALLYNRRKWMMPAGTTPTTHILKPRMGKVAHGIDLTDSVENEYLCMKLCEAFGLPTAQVEIKDFAGTQALSVERFDRLWTKDKRLLRVPQEDFCQSMSVPPSSKYESDGGPTILDGMALLNGSDTPAEDRTTFLKAQIVFWLLGATDGHAKNFSVFLFRGGGFRMTPIYDVLSVQPAVDAGGLTDKKFKLAMAVGDGRHYAVNSVVPRHFTQTAKRAGFGEKVVSKLIEELGDMAPGWMDAVGAKLPAGFPEQVVASIRAGVEQRVRAIGLRKKTPE